MWFHVDDPQFVPELRVDVLHIPAERFAVQLLAQWNTVCDAAKSGMKGSQCSTRKTVNILENYSAKSNKSHSETPMNRVASQIPKHLIQKNKHKNPTLRVKVWWYHSVQTFRRPCPGPTALLSSSTACTHPSTPPQPDGCSCSDTHTHTHLVRRGNDSAAGVPV